MAEKQTVTIDGARFVFTLSAEDGVCSHNKADRLLLAQMGGESPRPYYLADLLADAVSEKVLTFFSLRRAARALTLWLDYYRLGEAFVTPDLVPITALMRRIQSDESAPIKPIRTDRPARSTFMLRPFMESASYEQVLAVAECVLEANGQYVEYELKDLLLAFRARRVPSTPLSKSTERRLEECYELASLKAGGPLRHS